RSRIALRQKRAKTGQLDAKATIRANLKHGGVPLEIKHRNHRLKPKLVIFCDISKSMRDCAELVFSLIYSLQDVITKTHSFAYHDHLEYISPDFAGKQPVEVIYGTVAKMTNESYRTDFGYSLDEFGRNYMDLIDNRTTVIVVGDGCNNGFDPRFDLFETIARRSRRTIWIVTEMHAWTHYDSDMAGYAPLCDNVLTAYTLGELTNIVDQLLSQH
ncbi:MAG: VWA domain-containing protein, partial [Caldilineaceae bacterium]|nr:VWA domain-containing protein [Caldilineaceae bacterium]